MNLSIKNASSDLVERLRLRAKRNHRSLQGEMLAILERAAGDEDQDAASVGHEHARFDQAAGATSGLHESRQTFVGHAGAVASRADIARARAADRAVELMQRGLSFGDRRFTRDEMHER